MARTLPVLTAILLFLPRLFYDLDDPIGIPQVGRTYKFMSLNAILIIIVHSLFLDRECSFSLV